MRGIEAALKILTDSTDTNNIFASEALRKLADREKMKASDISLASSLIYIFMRRRELWQKILIDGKYIREKLPVPVNVALLTGIGGILELRRFSEGVLINGIIEYLKQNKLAKFSGVVNAVLRKILENGKDLLTRYKTSNSLENKALFAGVPLWTLPAWNRTWNKNELKEIFGMFDIPAYSCVRNSDGSITRLNETVLPTSLEGFNEGLVTVQSESSILAASLVKKFYSGKNMILDMCSGRGVKAGQILQENESAKIECWELSEKRSKSAERELERLHVKDRAIFRVGNALKIEPQSREKFSFVMLDSPCSCSGTWHRKPESKWRLDWQKFDNLVMTQKNLLERAVNLCETGGNILYITCSLLKQENENVVAEILAKYPECTEISTLIEWNDKKIFRKGRPYGIYILPCNSWLDGFYCSLIMKR